MWFSLNMFPSKDPNHKANRNNLFQMIEADGLDLSGRITFLYKKEGGLARPWLESLEMQSKNMFLRASGKEVLCNSCCPYSSLRGWQRTLLIFPFHWPDFNISAPNSLWPVLEPFQGHDRVFGAQLHIGEHLRGEMGLGSTGERT